MGQTASSIKDAAIKQNQDAEKTANNSLTTPQDLVKLQTQLFAPLDDKDPYKIDIKKTVSDESILRCSVDMDSDKVAGDIESTYGKFASGDIAKGIGSDLSIGLKALFGNASGNSNTTQKYFITVGELSYPLRIDMFCNLRVHVDDLIKVTKNVVATSVVVSSVDIVALDEATIGALVMFCYGEANEKINMALSIS